MQLRERIALLASHGCKSRRAMMEMARISAEFLTPTGHHYRSTAPPAPGPILIHISEVETRIGIAIARRDAS